MDEVPMSTREAALFLGVTERTITNWAKSGKLTPVGRFGLKRAYMFAREDLERLRSTEQADEDEETSQ